MHRFMRWITRQERIDDFELKLELAKAQIARAYDEGRNGVSWFQSEARRNCFAFYE